MYMKPMESGARLKASTMYVALVGLIAGIRGSGEKIRTLLSLPEVTAWYLKTKAAPFSKTCFFKSSPTWVVNCNWSLIMGKKTLTSRIGWFNGLIEATLSDFWEILKQQRRGRIAQRSLKVRKQTKGIKMRTCLDKKNNKKIIEPLRSTLWLYFARTIRGIEIKNICRQVWHK